MRNIPALLQTHIEGEVTSLTRCLKITKKNGDVLRITECDIDLVVNGDTYFTGVPFDSSAIQSTDTLAVDNAEITLGFIDDLVERDDFDDGLYDEAPFELFITNWEDTSDGIAYLKRGTLGAITFNNETSVTIQLRGLTQALQKPVVEKYSPTCRVNLGGDKCGIINIPNMRMRRNRQRVKTWDWFLIPTNNVTSHAISNLGFEVDLTGWTTPSGSDWDRDNAFTAGAGTWYVVGGAPGGLAADSGYEMSFYRDLGTLADLGLANVDVDDGDYSIDFAGLMALANASNENPGKMFVEQYDADGRTLKRTESKWIVPVFEEWEGIGVTEFILPGCRTIRFGLMNRIDSGTQGYVAFDDLTIRTWPNALNTFASRSFRTVRLPLPDPQERFSMDEGVESAIADFIDPPTAQNVTDGWYVVDLRFAAPANFDIVFLDDSGTLSTVSFVGQTRGIARLPTTTTRIRYDSASTITAAYLFATAYESEVDEEYGQLATSLPTYDYDLQDYTVDGDAIVQARAVVFDFTTVTDTVDTRTFEATGINQTAALAYSGKIVWISGANAGMTSFIRIWDNSTKLVKMYTPLRGDIAIGDKFVYAIGCDKTIARCADTFGNAHNFRGEPYLPGPTRVIEFMTSA